MALILSLLSHVAAANSLAPFSCALKNNEKDLPASTPESVKQWLALLGVYSVNNLDSDPPLIGDLRFKEQYFNSLKMAGPLVRDCDQAIAFWNRFGSAVEKYFDEYPVLNLALSRAHIDTILYKELNVRKKIQLVNGVPQIFLSQLTTPFKMHPLWTQELEVLRDNEVVVKGSFGLRAGPIGALSSYEVLRQISEQFPYFLSQNDDLINQRQHERIASDFPSLKGLLSVIHSLPPRHKILRALKWTYLVVACCLAILIIFTTYRRSRAP